MKIHLVRKILSNKGLGYLSQNGARSMQKNKARLAAIMNKALDLLPSKFLNPIKKIKKDVTL